MCFSVSLPITDEIMKVQLFKRKLQKCMTVLSLQAQHFLFMQIVANKTGHLHNYGKYHMTITFCRWNAHHYSIMCHIYTSSSF